MSARGRTVLAVLSVLLAVLSVLYSMLLAPDPSVGVRLYYSHGPDTELRLLNTSSSAAAAAAAGSVWAESLSRLPLPPDGAQLVVIIHGYTESIRAAWVHRVARALQSRHRHSAVLVVDYFHLTTISRPLMNSNINRVAATVAGLLDYLATSRNFSLSRVHVLCFSLGCRVAGGVGVQLLSSHTIGRITGVDPSGPWAGYLPPQNHTHFLDDSDADRVVVLRASKLSAGGPRVEADFTANGGLLQEGCYAWYKPQVALDICSHYRPLEYVVEALTDASAFPACPCSASSPGACPDRCDNPVNFMHDQVPPGIYHFKTSGTAPYSRQLPSL